MQDGQSFSSVIKNRGFLNLWINQILVQLSQNGLNFTLIIWVFYLTDSNTAISALLLAIYLPAVIFGLFAGVLVDITDRKKIIMTINLLLVLCFLSLILIKNFYLAILITAFLVNTLAQVYTPAESSAIPLIVKKKQLLAANSLFSVTLFATFLIGFALAGPTITHLGVDFIFGAGATLLMLAFLLSFLFPPIINKANQQIRTLRTALTKRDWAILMVVGVSEIQQTLSLIREKLSVLSAILILASVQVVIGILATIFSSFLERSLGIAATDATYVLVIPLGLGMIVGGFLIGKIGHRFPKRTIVSRAILLSGVLFFLVGIAPLISPVIKYFPQPKPLPFFYQINLAKVLIVGSFLLGAAMVAIIIPSQTVLQEHTTEQIRGKVYAVLGALMASLTLLPVLVIGVLADLFGPTPIFIGLGGLISLLGLFVLKPDFYFERHHLPLRFRQFLGLGHWQKKNVSKAP